MSNVLINPKANKEMSSIAECNFQNYLKSLGLPYKNIISSVSNRKIMQRMLPYFISRIPLDIRSQSTYISKFVASAAIGLNDAALNYLWDAVIKKIRKLVISYGLNIFYNAAFSGNKRKHYKDASDLSRVHDRELLVTCRQLGIIENIPYKELIHILNSRNDIGASHPNEAQIGPAELLGDLEVCVKYVFKNKISEAVIKVPRLIKHIKYSKYTLNDYEISALVGNFKDMSVIECDAILKTLFGMFTDTTIHNKQTRKNILLISPQLWKYSDDNIKYKFGIYIRSYEKTFDHEKEKLGEKFLSKCNGLNYETKDDRSVHLSKLSSSLINEHYGLNNYYSEVPIIQNIMKFIKSDKSIPKNVESSLIFSILKCSLGKPGISYYEGVSPNAQPYYHKFFALLNEDQIKMFFNIVVKNKSILSLYDKYCNKHFLEILSIFKSDKASTLLTDSLSELIDYFFSNKNLNSDQILSSSKFQLIYRHIM